MSVCNQLSYTDTKIFSHFIPIHLLFKYGLFKMLIKLLKIDVIFHVFSDVWSHLPECKFEIVKANRKEYIES